MAEPATDAHSAPLDPSPPSGARPGGRRPSIDRGAGERRRSVDRSPMARRGSFDGGRRNSQQRTSLTQAEMAMQLAPLRRMSVERKSRDVEKLNLQNEQVVDTALEDLNKELQDGTIGPHKARPATQSPRERAHRPARLGVAAQSSPTVITRAVRLRIRPAVVGEAKHHRRHGQGGRRLRGTHACAACAIGVRCRGGRAADYARAGARSIFKGRRRHRPAGALRTVRLQAVFLYTHDRRRRACTLAVGLGGP